MRCIVCGGDHEPSASICDADGMDREAARMGARKWNAITAQVMRRNQETCICGVPGCRKIPPNDVGGRS